MRSTGSTDGVEHVEGDRDWEDDIGKKPRWGFTGVAAVDFSHYRNHSVKHLYKAGDQSIKSFNC